MRIKITTTQNEHRPKFNVCDEPWAFSLEDDATARKVNLRRCPDEYLRTPYLSINRPAGESML